MRIWLIRCFWASSKRYLFKPSSLSPSVKSGCWSWSRAIHHHKFTRWCHWHCKSWVVHLNLASSWNHLWIPQHLYELDNLTVGMILLQLLFKWDACHQTCMAVHHSQCRDGVLTTFLSRLPIRFREEIVKADCRNWTRMGFTNLFMAVRPGSVRQTWRVPTCKG